MREKVTWFCHPTGRPVDKVKLDIKVSKPDYPLYNVIQKEGVAMAKYEREIKGNFDEVLGVCEKAVMGGSLTASYEDSSDFVLGNVQVAVRVYERYSMLGNNRVSLNITLAGTGDTVFLSAIAAGGSQAMVFKINTIGESSFLNTFAKAVERHYP